MGVFVGALENGLQIAFEKQQKPSEGGISNLLARTRQAMQRNRSTADSITRGKSATEAKPAFRADLVATDQRLIEYYYREFNNQDVHPIATDQYMDKSRDTYNEAWLARELIQNFVDHNPKNPGTLDGVKITSEQTPDGKGRRFVIEGDWPFEDVTGVISPHSEKPAGHNTAGGNGIGLKQGAIRLLRDFGVGKFEIQGEGWTVDYQLAKAADINQDLSEATKDQISQRVKHDWLIANMKREDIETGKCRYVIETTNEHLITALEKMPELGVSSENPFLQNPDFKNQHGAIKWLPVTPDLDHDSLPQGRLYINGQVMNFKTQGKSAEDYWTGPELVTIRLNDVKYQMSVDRPPISSLDLNRYIHTLTGSMSKEDALDQLHRSSEIWTKIYDEGWIMDRPGCFILIESIVQRLRQTGYKPDEYANYFENDKLLCLDRGVTKAQLDELKDQGYTICPPYFESIGMPKANGKLSSIEQASNIKPDIVKEQTAKKTQAEDSGIQVGYLDMNYPDVNGFFGGIREQLSDYIQDVEFRTDKKNTIRIKLNEDIQEALLSSVIQKPKPGNRKQELLYLVRGIAKKGLELNAFDKIYSSQGQYVTTYAQGYDFATEETYLIARNVKSLDNSGFFVEIELNEDDFTLLQAALAKKTEKSATNKEPDGAVKVAPVEESVKKLSAIPVQQPPRPETRGAKVIEKNVPLSPEEETRMQAVAKIVPEITKAVQLLESATPSESTKTKTDDDPIQQYIDWRKSDDFYGEAGREAGYLTGRHLVDILNEQNQADIAVVRNTRKPSEAEKTVKQLNAALQQINNQLKPTEDEVDEFAIDLEPSERQLAQLALLRSYSCILTGIALPNDLFIYKGTGSKGVNIAKKAIGLHEEILNVSFTEALSTFIHEIAHNEEMSHDANFIRIVQSIFVTTIGQLQEIGLKASQGQSLTPEEQVVIDIQRVWNELQTK